jgi:hypothetical protein
MRGPKLVALAVLGLFASSVLAIHLLYLGEPPAPDVSAPAAPSPAEPLASLGGGAPPDALPGAGESFPGLPDLGVTDGVPPPAGSADWERRVNDCVERNVHGPGYDDVKPKQTLPGRWPALKRAREVRRLRRLEVKAACVAELARRQGP